MYSYKNMKNKCTTTRAKIVCVYGRVKHAYKKKARHIPTEFSLA